MAGWSFDHGGTVDDVERNIPGLVSLPPRILDANGGSVVLSPVPKSEDDRAGRRGVTHLTIRGTEEPPACRPLLRSSQAAKQLLSQSPTEW